MSNDLQIFVLSFGRSNVPTLAHIKDKSRVIVLTSEDNKFKDKIDLQGAQLMVFDKDQFKGRGIEMMNDETVPHRRSAVYGYNYAIDWCRKNGVRYCLVLDDDYTNTTAVNNRKSTHHPMLDLWAEHAVSLLRKHPEIAATCSINTGQLFAGATSAYYMNIDKRQLMNTIIFDVTKEHNFISLGNGDYVTHCITNSMSRDMIVRTQTIMVQMETIQQKKHESIDYSNLFYARWAAKMASPAYADVSMKSAGKRTNMSYRFNTYYRSNSAPKIVSL